MSLTDQCLPSNLFDVWFFSIPGQFESDGLDHQKNADWREGPEKWCTGTGNPSMHRNNIINFKTWSCSFWVCNSIRFFFVFPAEENMEIPKKSFFFWRVTSTGMERVLNLPILLKHWASAICAQHAAMTSLESQARHLAIRNGAKNAVARTIFMI